MRLKIRTILSTLGLGQIISATASESLFTMPEGVSADIYDLHMTIFWICVALGITVFSLLIYSTIKYRKTTGQGGKKFADHHTVELIWVVIPSIILIAMAIPATLILMHMDNIHHTNVATNRDDQKMSVFSALSTPTKERQNLQK